MKKILSYEQNVSISFLQKLRYMSSHFLWVSYSYPIYEPKKALDAKAADAQLQNCKHNVVPVD